MSMIGALLDGVRDRIPSVERAAGQGQPPKGEGGVIEPQETGATTSSFCWLIHASEYWWGVLAVKVPSRRPSISSGRTLRRDQAEAGVGTISF